MSSFLIQGSGLPEKPPPNDKQANKSANKDNDLGVSNELDSEVLLTDEQRRAAQQEAIMIQDLGSGVRDRITMADSRRVPNISLRQLQRDRAVEKIGSEANKAYLKNKEKLNGWNNLHVELRSDDDANELDAMMDGQSHRARLREVVANDKDQHDDPHGNDDASCRTSGAHATRGGTVGRGSRGGGFIGTRGRGATNPRRGPITAGNVLSRPLDPAIDPDDPRSKYSIRRGSAQNAGGSRQENRSPPRSFNPSIVGLGRGGTAQDVRASMVGTTVQVSPSSARLPQVRQPAAVSSCAPASLAANHAPRKAATGGPGPPARVPHIFQGGDDMLNPKWFLAALASTKDRETFNKMISCQPKPAPAPRAADIVAKSSKKAEIKPYELARPSPRPPIMSKGFNTISSLDIEKRGQENPFKTDAQGIPEGATAGKSAVEEPETEKLRLNQRCFDIPIHENQKLERSKLGIPNAKVIPEKVQQGEVIKQVQTNQTVSPPPNPRSTKVSGGIDAYIDRAPTPGKPDFSASTEDGPKVGSGNVIQGLNDGKAASRSSVTTETTMPVVGLPTRAEPTSIPRSIANADADLLMLGSEEVDACGGSTLIAQSTQVHGAVADLMDLDFNQTSHESLAPILSKPLHLRNPQPVVQPVEPLAATVERPAFVVIGGIRYYREDQLPQVVTSEAGTDSTAAISVASTIPAATDRLITGRGYTIGVRHLSPRNRNILGDRNVVRRVEESKTTLKVDSIWAAPRQPVMDRRHVKASSPVRIDRGSALETVVDSDLSLDPMSPIIGDRNLPRKPQPVSQSSPTRSANSPSRGGSFKKPRFARHPQGIAMSHEANPWSTGRSAASTEPRASDLAKSKWSEANAKDLTGLSQNDPDESQKTGLAISSSGTTPLGLLGGSLVSFGGGLGSNPNDFRSHTSENAAPLSLEPTKVAEEQQVVSTIPPLPENISIADSSASQSQETLSELMVRLTRSHGSTGLRPRHVECRGNESRQSHDSTSSGGNSGGSPHSEVTVVKSAMNLNTSKWAREVPTTSSTTTNFSAKSAKAKSHFPSAKGSNIQLMPRDSKLPTPVTQINAGPGFGLLVANAPAAAATSDSVSTAADTSVANSIALTENTVELPLSSASQAAVPNTRESSVVDAKSGLASRSTRYSQDNRSNLGVPTITSEPRVRVINQRMPLGQSPVPRTVQRGESLPEKQDDQGGSDSEESEL